MRLISSSIPNLVNGVSQQPYVLRLTSQAESQVNGLSSVVEGLKKRPPTRYLKKISDTSFGAAFFHGINRDTSERYVMAIGGGGLRVFDLSGNEYPVHFPNGASYLSSAAPSTDFTAVTVADYTFVLNRAYTARMSSVLSDSWTNAGLVWIKQGGYSITYTINCAGWTVSHTTPDGSEASHKALIATDYIAAQLAAKLVAIADFNNYFTIQMLGSTICFYCKTTGEFLLDTADGLGDDAMQAVTKQTQRFTDLPARAPHGFKVEIAGDNTTSFDNYYVTFYNPIGSASTGVWKESLKGGELYKLDGSTMPHALIRQADGSFSFQQIDWTERKVGDSDSVEPPSLIGKTINDIFFHRNRLGFVADENVVFSRAGDFFNLFRASATEVLDTDPIDVAVSHTKVSIIRHAIPFDQTLLLFSDQTQFMLGAADTLTPSTISINQTTEFQASLTARPVAAGRNVYFAVNKGKYSGIREYYVDADTETTDAAEVTAHVPHYIPSDITMLATASNEDILVAITPNEPNAMYVYKYYWQGTEKLQSSWSKWTFSSSTIIRYVQFIESNLYLLIEHNGQVMLEVMSLEAGAVDDGTDFVFHLDQRFTASQAASVTYDAATNVTKILPPYWIEDASQFKAVSLGDGAHKLGKLIPLVWDGTYFQVSGNVSAFLIGRSYEFRYRFSTLVLKETSEGGGQQAIGAGRLQLRRMTLTYSSSGYFRAEVTPFRRDTYNSVFSGRIVGSGKNILGTPAIETGRFRFPISGQNETTTIDIVNDSPLPSALLSAEWEASFVTRSTRA